MKIYEIYERFYQSLINKRRADPPDKNKYFEIHHILPKSLGGKDNKENLVKLTAREHYIAHALLYKIYSGRNNKNAAMRMAIAINFLSHGNKKFVSEAKISSRMYEFIKTEISKHMSKIMSGKQRYYNEQGEEKLVSEPSELPPGKWTRGSYKKSPGSTGYRYIRNIITDDVMLIPSKDKLPNGYIFGGPVNKPNKTRWINDGKINRKIKCDEKLPDGWIFGRIMPQKIKNHYSNGISGTEGKIMIYNTKTKRKFFIFPADVGLYVFDGSPCVVGIPKSLRRIPSESEILAQGKTKVLKNHPELINTNFDYNIYKFMSKRNRKKYLKSFDCE